MTHAVAIDLGSVRCGVVRGPAEGAPRVTLADVVEPVADDDGRPLLAAVDALAVHIVGAAVCVLEIGPLYMPQRVTPQAAREIALAHATCERIADAVAERCRAMMPSVPVVRCARQRWAHRLVPHHSGGILQALARAAVLRHLEGTGSEPLPGDDRIDAAGAYLWAVLPELPKARRGRKGRRGRAAEAFIGPRVPRGYWARVDAQAMREAWAAVRLVGRCVGCPRKHRRWCPMAPPPKLRGLTDAGMARAKAALAGMMPRRATP